MDTQQAGIRGPLQIHVCALPFGGILSVLTPMTVPRGTIDWVQEFRDRMDRLNTRMAAFDKRTKKAQGKKRYRVPADMLMDQDIDFALESVWGALYQHTEHRMAYCRAENNQNCRGAAADLLRALAWVPGAGESRLIMPLTGRIGDFGLESRRNNYSDMHHLLVVAERRKPETKPKPGVKDEVCLTLYDSYGSGTESRQAVFAAAQEVAENCGWLEQNVVGQPVRHPINVVERRAPDCPRQGSAATCGLFTVLNACKSSSHLCSILCYYSLRSQNALV